MLARAYTTKRRQRLAAVGGGVCIRHGEHYLPVGSARYTEIFEGKPAIYEFIQDLCCLTPKTVVVIRRIRPEPVTWLQNMKMPRFES